MTPALWSLRQKDCELQELVRKKEVEQEKDEKEAGRRNNKSHEWSAQSCTAGTGYFAPKSLFSPSTNTLPA